MFRKFVVSTFLLLFSAIVYADMGAVVPAGDVDLHEPGQKAIIFYNGTEEILILGTDLKSSKSAQALRFIPLPSEPKINLAPKECFNALNRLLTKYDLKYLLMYKGKGGLSEGQSVELRFHKKLGAHDITVIKVNNALHFREWVNSYFKEKGLPLHESYPEIENVVSDYIDRGIAYFAFDFVEVTENISSIQPIVYKFKSKKLYYPLKTSNIFGGTGRIDLIVFAHFAQTGLSGAPFIASSSAKIGIEEISDIYPDSKQFFNNNSIILQAFKYQGMLSFWNDILMDYSQGVEELKPSKPRTEPWYIRNNKANADGNELLDVNIVDEAWKAQVIAALKKRLAILKYCEVGPIAIVLTMAVDAQGRIIAVAPSRCAQKNTALWDACLDERIKTNFDFELTDDSAKIFLDAWECLPKLKGLNLGIPPNGQKTVFEALILLQP